MLFPVIVVAATVLATSSIEKAAEQRGFERIQHSQQVLAVWLDRSNALRVFLQTGDTAALGTFDRLGAPFAAALARERADARGVAAAQPVLGRELGSAQRWHTLALSAAATIRRRGVRPLAIAVTKPRSDASAEFQAANQRYTAVMEARRRSDIGTASELGIAIVVVAVLILALAALAVTRASRGREKRLMEERMLAVSAQRVALDDAQRIARVGSWSWDTESDRATWTGEMYAIFGRDPARGPATWDELLAHVHPDDRDRLAAGYADFFGGGPSFELDCHIVLESGETRTVHGIGRREPDRPGVYVGTVQDVTELRMAERRLRRERDYGAAITSSMHEGFMLTRDGTILEVNQALCAMTGFARTELVGARAPYAFWAPEAAEEILRRRALIGEHGHDFEATYMRKDGTRFDAAITSVAARTADGELLGYVSTVRDVSERNRHLAELERLATHDPLSGLANYRVFHDRLRSEVARASRNRQPLSVAVIDLDHFKEINDHHGHLAGDSVLRELGERLRGLTREGELVARVGGEEFAWILNVEGPEALAAAERLRRTVIAKPFSQVGAVTMSVGVCGLIGTDDADELYEGADRALYTAKREGRNRTCLSLPAPARAELSEAHPPVALSIRP
ncbi:MAG TPA: diguanylate cyclase [Solirubrobacteraceae bacterium]|nr:diguanylate cyclase [Solirubrobacteraceae bacterium]